VASRASIHADRVRNRRTFSIAFDETGGITMNHVIAIALVTAVFAASSIAAAQPETQDFVFDDDLVDGSLFGPTTEHIASVVRGKRASLIRVREHFIPEMLESVEDL
jgi:hypothetical protein